MFANFLTFSDAAKFALVARNLYFNNGFATDFSFWGDSLFATGGIPALLPYIILVFMKLFGVNDYAVLAFSFTFYLLLIIFVYLLANKLYGKLVGVLSSAAVASNINLIDYATSGASETLIAFEIVLGAYLILLKNRYANVLALIMLIIMYFSKPQAFIFMGCLTFLFLIVNFGIKRATIYFTGLSIVGFLVDKYIVYPLSFKYPLTPIFARGIQSILTYSSFAAVSDGLRGAASSTLNTGLVLKKVFYNLYNFYKAIPEILNPYLFTLFILGLFIPSYKKVKEFNDSKQVSKEINDSGFKLFSLVAVAATFLVTALTIPFYRYLHPVVPLIYIVSIATLIKIANVVFAKKYASLISIILILIFAIGQTLGVMILDSRFEKQRVNHDKPAVYMLLSHKLKELTRSEDLILTNLDTWGSWYGERKTVWFPLTPKLFTDTKYQFDAIYLTSYKIDDDNYRMGDEWRQIYQNPKDESKWMCEGCDQIANNFEFKEELIIPDSQTYERQEGKAILLVREFN